MGEDRQRKRQNKGVEEERVRGREKKRVVRARKL